MVPKHDIEINVPQIKKENMKQYMNVEKLVMKLLTEFDPEDELIFDFWHRKDFTVYDAEDKEVNPTVEQWRDVIDDFNSWHQFVQYTYDFINESVIDKCSGEEQ